MSVNIPNRDGEARINRAFRMTTALVACIAAIGTGAYFIARIPKSRPIDSTPAPGPIDTQPARAAADALLTAIPLHDVAAQSGLTFSRTVGSTEAKLLPQTMGGGVAVLDADNDGDQDIVLLDGRSFSGAPFESATTNETSSIRLYLNETTLPAGALRFRECASSGLKCDLFAMGIAVGDYDGDRLTDIYVTGVGANQLFRNELGADGTVHFRDVTTRAGANPPSPHARWGTSAGFFDADRDGDLDLLVCNYVQWSPDLDRSVNYTLAGIGRAFGPPTGFAGDDLLFLSNQGDGTFVDATIASGFAVQSALGLPVGKALGLVFVDPDHDGDLDVVVANDTVAKGLFVNDGRGQFENRAAASGIAFDRNGAATGAMGIDAAFLRPLGAQSDNDLAIAVGNFANEPDSLYVSHGESATFSDDAIIEGLAAPTRAVLTFGLVFVDIDLDGDLDLAQANGHIETEINRVQPSQTYAQRGQLFVNQRAAAPCFVEVPSALIGDLATPRVGRGLTYGDFDLDGDIDLVLAQASGAVALLRNDQVQGKHWLRIALKGKPPNTSAIGAEIELVSGGVTHRRTVSATRSYLAQSELPATFGLGSATTVERLQIRWPSGSTSTITVHSVDQQLSIDE